MRRTWLVLCVLLALMCGLLCALWFRSLFASDDLTWRRETSDGPNWDIWYFTLASGKGKLLIRDAAEIWSLQDYSPFSSSPEKWRFQGHRVSSPAVSPLLWSTNGKEGPMGLVGAWERSPASIHHEAIVPIWFPLLIFFLLALFFLHRCRRGIVLPNHCPGCGYDLRATPGRCPECGLQRKPSNDK